MAVTIVQTKSAQGAGATVSVSITTTAANLLGVVTGSGGLAAGLPSRTGETFNNAVADFNDGSAGPEHLRGDYAMNIGGNSNTVTGNGSTGTACCVTEFQGAKTSAALGLTSTATSAAATVTNTSITPTAHSGLMTGVTQDGTGTGADTIDSGFTVDEIGGTGTVWDQASVVGGSAHHDDVAASATIPKWTSGSAGTTHMATFIMEFLSAVAVAATTPISQRTVRGAG